MEVKGKDSMYSQFPDTTAVKPTVSGDKISHGNCTKEKPIPDNVRQFNDKAPKQVIKSNTAHPYTKKAVPVTVSAIIPKGDRAANGWGRFIMTRQPISHFETEINKSFDRAIVGVKFEEEKARYLALWKKQYNLLNS